MSLNLNRLYNRLRGENGVFLPAAAIVIPAILGMMAYGLDSANLLSKKARMADAVDQATLAVSAWGLSTMSANEKKAAEDLTLQYLKQFIPDLKETPKITVNISTRTQADSGAKYTSYEISASTKVPLIFDMGLLPGLGHNVEVSSGTSRVNKTGYSPTDFAFVVDFSGSEIGERSKMIKDVVKEISEIALLNNEANKVAILPFSNGVPVKLPGKNERGGDRVGCSVMFVPNKSHDINYEFWSDKYTVSNRAIASRLYHMDDNKYKFYRDFVANSRPVMSTSSFRDKWCVKNPSYGDKIGHAEYSCKDVNYPHTDIFSKNSMGIIATEYEKAYRVQQDQMARQWGWIHDVRSASIVNEQSVNYTATLEKMFDKNAVITFPILWTKQVGDTHRGFNAMCENSGWMNHVSGNNYPNSTARSWLIELTHDIKVIQQFQGMLQAGWTQVSAGLLRAVPVMMAGRNARKVFIIITDGDDSAGGAVTSNFVKNHKLCQKIQEGFLARPETKTQQVGIYYISTTKDAARVKFWGDNCTGTDRAKTSVNKSELIDTLKGILSEETGNFAQ